MATVEKPELSKYRDRMDKAVAALKEEFASLRTGRASASLLDQVNVEAYGSTMPINQVRRKDLAKIAGKYAEQQRIAVRNIRREANDDLRAAEKAHVISQDEEKRMEADVQKLTDEAIKRVDEALKTKEQEIMHV